MFVYLGAGTGCVRFEGNGALDCACMRKGGGWRVRRTVTFDLASEG